MTGIVLVIEMTAAFTTLLPMMAACFAAMVAANLLRTAPIYDSSRERVAKQTNFQRNRGSNPIGPRFALWHNRDSDG